MSAVQPHYTQIKRGSPFVRRVRLSALSDKQHKDNDWGANYLLEVNFKGCGVIIREWLRFYIGKSTVKFICVV